MSNVKNEILEICRKLNAKNMLASADGNVSFRISNQEIIITPTGKNKASIQAEDLAVINLDNQILGGKPSGERLMHLEVYRRCPLAKAVVHAHPPIATAWSIAFPKHKELPAECISELILAVGSIPIVPYVRPGTAAMGEALRPFLPKSRVMILGRHGALSWGEDLSEAYNGMERLEHSALVLKAAIELNGLSYLAKKEVKALRELRKSLGDRTL